MNREEASKLLHKLCGCSYHYYLTETEAEAVDMALKALEQPEQKKGKWICHDAKEGFLIKKYTCSICNYYSGTQKPNFCPNCGAKMDKED